MTRKAFYITLGIGTALGIASIVLAFMDNFNVAFWLMLIAAGWGICFDKAWRNTCYNGFDD